MSLGQHLVELRRRLVIAMIALVVGMAVAYFLTDWIIGAMTEPIRIVAELRVAVGGREGQQHHVPCLHRAASDLGVFTTSRAMVTGA